jgi:predicted metal-dependent HD superfamily phosphohydrolase
MQMSILIIARVTDMHHNEHYTRDLALYRHCCLCFRFDVDTAYDVRMDEHCRTWRPVGVRHMATCLPSERFDISMSQPDIVAARSYALRRLEHELEPQLRYHSVWHTRDVLEAAERLATLDGIDTDQLVILQTAALFHDLGFVVTRIGHEAASIAITTEVLPGFGYLPEQIKQIGQLIEATRLPQSPQSPLAELLADADLDVLGRPDFLQRSSVLREELASFDGPMSDSDWFVEQLTFVTQHHYWTSTARRLRDQQKAKNIEMLRAYLAACQPSEH